MPDEFKDAFPPEDLDNPPSFFPREEGENASAPTERILVQVRIAGIFVAENNGTSSRFVLLTDDERKLPIMIGGYEASAIQFAIEHTRSDRPMTHDLIKSIVEKLEADVDRVVIDDLYNTIFYAKLHLRRGEDEIIIDARPSDAIAIAARFEAPIFVADHILESATIE